MTARKRLWVAPVLLLILTASLPMQAAKVVQRAKAPVIDAKATDLVRQMGDYLTSLQAFSVHVETMKDLVLPTDQALVSDTAFDLMLQRPDKLRVNKTSAAGQTQVFYDGKIVTVFTPEKNYYAVSPAPPTIEETLQAALKRGISMPLAEFIYKNPSRKLLANVQSAMFVGSALVEGVMTNHLAFRQKDVDWQIWVQDSQTPLPVKLVIVDRSQKDSPRFMALLSNWNVNPTFDESTFSFVPPDGASQIKFSELPKRPGMMKPAPKK
jgi:hypothetical protein